jgi:DNA-binding CsgD family transcriptional regulator
LVTAERLSRLLLLLYEGASAPGQMAAFLAELTEAVGATGAVFREHTFSASRSFHVDTTDLSETIGYSDEALSVYVKHFWEKDIYLQRCLERFRTADCGVSQLLTTKAELQRNDFHADYLVPFDVGPMMWAKIAERPDYHASISIVRPNRAAFFEQAELELLTALAPHLRQALWLTRTLHNLQGSNAMLAKTVDEMGIAICMARQDGSILRSTEGVEQLFAAQDGVSLHSGKLRVMLPREQQALDALIAGACNTGANRGVGYAIRVQANAAGDTPVGSWTAQGGGAVLITRKLSLRPLQVVVSPFHPGTLLNEPQATALIQFSDPYAAPKSRAAVLRALYALTPTESRLADHLLQGLEVRETADRMNITVETARIHLKRVLAKTDTRRQAELMRLMLSLPGQ